MAITQGMVGSPVYSEDGTHLGTVKEVRGDSFKVDAQMQPDYWLRVDSVRSTNDGRIVVMNDATRGEGDDYEASGATTERREHTEGHAHTAATGAAEMRTGRENESIQLREERLRVEKEREQAGEVRLGKRVTEQEETVEVPLREERVVIERTPVTGEARTGEITGRDETIEVPLMRERANVEKETVVTEEVNVRKESVQRNEQVQATVRKEELEVEGEGDVATDNPNASRRAGHEHEQTRRG